MDDSTHLISQLTRPFQNINLNDSSDSSTRDSLSIVQSYHSNLIPFPGAPANLPGDAIDCAACRSSIIESESETGDFLVCDGCELGFHIDCIGMRGREVRVDEWLCCECSRKLRTRAKGEKRCRKNKLVDVNGNGNDLPRGDGEGEDSRFSRKHNPCDNTFGGNPFGVPVPSSSLLQRENRFCFQASDLVHRSVQLGPEELIQPNDSQIQSVAEFDVCPSLARFKSSSNKRPLPCLRKKMCLETLREFISRSCGGVLEEGWSVEFKNTKSKDEFDVLYCAPDGKKFESMLEVARYLGLSPTDDTTECERRSYEFDVSVLGSSDPKRRKTATPTNGDARGKEDVLDDFNKDQFSDIKNAVIVGESANCTKVMDANSEETSGSTSREYNDGYPIQYEDFFIISAGKIDCRPSYYNANEIWPIGYKSCWHDKVTGSLFICEVLDGGDSGPVFRVQRSSCSRLSIPVGSTVLYKSNPAQLAGQHEENNFYAICADEEYSILNMLSDPSPQEHDLLFCLGSTNCSNDQTSEGQFLETSPCEGKPESVFMDNTVLQDVIGEISVEERSSFQAWQKVCGKLIDAFQNVFTRTGTFEYFCKHAAEATCSSKWDIKNQKLDENVDPLTKFCGLIRLADIPSIILDRKAFEVSSELLSKWLDQDRFGLNVEFVQELLEPNLGAIACHEYVRLKERETCLSSLTIGNGFLLAKTKDGVDLTSDKLIDELTGSCQTSNIPAVNDHVMDDNFIPPGKPVNSSLPPSLLSDALQVQEFLIRFHDVLELRDLFSFEELEKELISPWFDCLDDEIFLGASKKCLDITHITVDTDSGPAVSDKDSHAVLHRKTIKTKEEPQGQLRSIALDRCNGFALTKIHCSLIRVLIGELQSKVAAIEKDADCWISVMQMENPEFGIGELKSKRGRKKDSDADCRISELRTKMNILPLNELTWPELVRRYILSICSLGGKLNSADITTCESRNVFHCLQGDGGVFCGSPTGVAGKEADAAFLAEAIQNIFGSFIREHDMIAVDDVKYQDISERVDVQNFDLPEWAKVLEPVRKLPTNVGARIRRCINEALDKSPPEWAKKVLEHSISKGVYKGNASGPTKKAVISVLEDLQRAGLQQKPGIEPKKKRYISISDIIMPRCRDVLRRLAAHDDAKNLCNLLGRNFMNISCEDEGLLSSPTIVSRPLDFRTIDLKLAAGAYGGSHEAFFEDVREFWANVHIASKDKPDQIRLVEMLSQTFDSLYQTEVLTQFQKLEKCKQSDCVSVEALNEIDKMLGSPHEILKAPWEEGVCKVCEIDRDDDNVLLCDTCDAEYHKYCLDPPLAVIPEGNWYCPSCVAGTSIIRKAPDTWSNFLHCRKYQGDFTHAHLNLLAHLASGMEEREYWDLGVCQRSHLLTFLCDELLSSALVRQHIDQCTDSSAKLMQELRSTSAELKTLKYKEASLETKVAESDRSFTVLGTEMQQGCDKYITRHYSSQSKSDSINNFSGDLFQSNRDQTNAACDTPDLASFKDVQGLSSSLATENANVSSSYPIMFLNNSQPESSELTSVRTQILQLNNSIASLYSQFLKVSMRREFLGSDSSGRSYWVLADSGTQTSLISSRNGEMQQTGKIISVSSLEAVSPPFPCELGDNKGCPQWISYNCDAEITKLLHHLQDNNPRERELKESILQWESLVTRGNQLSDSQHLEGPQMASSLGNCKNVTSSNSLCTVATSLLEDKYGLCVALESSELSKIRMQKAKGIVQQNMHRCDCLEPIWPSRLHCYSCHRTFLTDVELDRHNDGKCSIALPASDKLECREISEGKSMIPGLEQGGYRHEMHSVSASRSGISRLSSSSIRHQNDKSVCPFDYEDICSKFLINESNKELVKGIGLIGSNGIPMFVPSISPHTSDSVAMLLPQEAVVVEADKLSNDLKNASLQDKTTVNANSINSFPNNPLQCAVKHQDSKISLHCGAPLCKVWNCCIVPEPSLRPLIGRAGYILRQLKINLLDMDAALPDEAIRPSRSKLERRWAWRSFVKSAERIYEMVQATVALEDMIKSEYLRSTWWYWSSLTMAAKVSTSSSLALRIYSLDAAIYYNKTSCSDSFQKKISSKKRKELET
ncbi:methyl-CpG-binding domain-containing protein 9 [Heracleum sosnowskyi]|uniref:Methyl-CpG-binding domain-containing protein 9 n=1 Tax=Heracleum sosnowskyi TaxID=360622 RepID=A0AAD8M4Q7_9APIA|nr:methyl-CpG-binding domain-containing protein 9 [Heracleum sosnowskyi]